MCSVSVLYALIRMSMLMQVYTCLHNTHTHTHTQTQAYIHAITHFTHMYLKKVLLIKIGHAVWADTIYAPDVPASM